MKVVACVFLCLAAFTAAETSSLTSEVAADGSVGRIDCMSRRGFGECRSLGLDCVETPVTQNGENAIQVEFPMLMHTVYFPCTQPFAKPPLVLTTIEGADNNKLYASSLRNSTEESFTINVQRVDDVDSPEMHCSDYKVCYIAIVV